jgi:DNA polymerase/3'-5' exonuclease PolX
MNFITKIKNKVVELFQKITGAAKKLIPVGIKVVEVIKKITDSKVADIIVELTANTDIDNKILEKVRKLLPKILKELEEWDDTINEEEALKASLAKINGYSKARRSLLYLGIATELNRELTGLDYRTALTATHEAYNEPELLA